MAKLVAFYSRAEENYFGGSMQYIRVGNTEKIAKMIAKIINELRKRDCTESGKIRKNSRLRVTGSLKFYCF